MTASSWSFRAMPDRQVSAAKHLTILADGAARGNPGPAAIGVVIMDETESILRELSWTIGKATNNQAEYQALIAGLEAAAEMRAIRVTVNMDSELVVRQLQGIYKVKSPKLAPLFQRAWELRSRFESFLIAHVPRERNRRADALANRALDFENRA